MTKRTGDMRFLTKGETKALLDAAMARSARDHAMILLAYRHGLRASETCNIMMQNIDLEAGNIRCERGKGSVCNWQQIGADEVKAVRKWLRLRPKTDDPHLFVSQRGGAMSRSQFFRVFAALAEEAGIPAEKRHPHVLKHSLGTHLANAGLPVQVIQSRLGHRNVQNTMIYLQISNAYVDKAFEVALGNGGVV